MICYNIYKREKKIGDVENNKSLRRLKIYVHVINRLGGPSGKIFAREVSEPARTGGLRVVYETEGK